MIDAETLRELRLMLREFADAQIDDWGDEANEPRLRELRDFIDRKAIDREILTEIILFAFFILSDALDALLEGFAPLLDGERVASEIIDYGERFPPQAHGFGLMRLTDTYRRGLE